MAPEPAYDRRQIVRTPVRSRQSCERRQIDGPPPATARFFEVSDSLRNILTDPRVALLFMVPGIGETLRVNGTAEILTSPDHLVRFVVAGKLPKSILRITVNSVFFQCSRAVIRAELWKQESMVARESLPSAGAILRTLSQATIDGDAYDRALPQRIADTLY